MKAIEIKKMSDAELDAKLKELKGELFNCQIFNFSDFHELMPPLLLL